ncbi:MAG: respiratory nitrate reductase subunit gamma [Aquabacterium sp.]|jgi:nitrate reductase gamma subunit|uniref:respiratory nitrate reductase subunit gamma n=1 Tax=Aquabacterium sp. TaxID=1872578 RepID=UPI001B5104FC|nr:respiratory nitrate reductase subunit gamma [Aquabacterium sp.]MBP7131657.1 respiratory nitrate reductase subunit gamma [Aquabacterium sp.]MBP9062252.1 respiratory nitrate reductase subunit gamma [Aquabacterium sp.]MDQ5925696.1 nitrate reductase gamma subunit [Pseudomonadota bacterium]
MSLSHHFIFGIYPYICGALFLLGSLMRFDREQYSWRSESSQMLSTGSLRVGSNLFHLGIIGLFFGHFVGMLTPHEVIHALGVTAGQKQMLAVVAGGILGTLALIGVLLLIHRRLTNTRVRATSTGRDFLVLFWILATLLLGLSTVPLSIEHSDGGTMLQLMSWAQHLVTFRGDAPTFITDVSIVFKVHMFMGMTLFAIFPFTRLVHVWSGFASVGYIARPWQIVRSRKIGLNK